METIKIIGLSILTACVYGIVHDQVTAHVCVEYFTVGHPPVFATQSPILLAFGWGILATWWVGLFLGIALACTARIGSRAKLSARQLLRPVATLLLVMAATALVAGIAGYVAARHEWVWLLEPLASQIAPNRHARFIADLWAHLASYGVGGLGGLTLCVLNIFRRRKMPINKSL